MSKKSEKTCKDLVRLRRNKITCSKSDLQRNLGCWVFRKELIFGWNMFGNLLKHLNCSSVGWCIAFVQFGADLGGVSLLECLEKSFVAEKLR